MNDSVLDILIYLFENYLDGDADADGEPQPSRDTLREELENAGFAESGIERALEWLEGLGSDDAPGAAGGEKAEGRGEDASRSFRVFSGYETARLAVEVRGYILHLENIGILSAHQRELVIDRLLALDAEEIDIEQVKWVVLMVLFSQPGQEQAYQRMEDLVFEGQSDALH
jgi:Smg protein